MVHEWSVFKAVLTASCASSSGLPPQQYNSRCAYWPLNWKAPLHPACTNSFAFLSSSSRLRSILEISKAKRWCSVHKSSQHRRKAPSHPESRLPFLVATDCSCGGWGWGEPFEHAAADDRLLQKEVGGGQGGSTSILWWSCNDGAHSFRTLDFKNKRII